MLRRSSPNKSTNLPSYSGSDFGYPSSGGYDGSHIGAGRRRSSRTGSFQAPTSIMKQPLPWVAIVAFLFFWLAMSYRGQQNKLLTELNAKSIDQVLMNLKELEAENSSYQKLAERTKTAQRQLQSRVSGLEQENRRLKKEKDELRVKFESQPVVEGSKDVMSKDDQARFEAREDAWKDQVLLLQQATVRESRRAVAERFGPGPHHVEFFFNLPTDAEGEAHRFVVEMAPLSAVPHAVHLFLEQVAHGLWDNGVFYLNGQHVLQVGPQNYEDDEEVSGDDDRPGALKPFKEMQLESLAFPEYSEDFPHTVWTLGMTGRPGGPDWYINKMDNSVAHGPGGQTHHELHEFGDPCFAIVTEGREELMKVFEMPIYNDNTDYHYFLQDPVEFINVTIMEDPPEPFQAEHEATNGDKKRKRRKFKMKLPKGVDVDP